jgi:hypothetical protein
LWATHEEEIMKYGAFIPRRPPLRRPRIVHTMPDLMYPTTPMQPIPIIASGHAVDHRPYPSREWPDYPMATTSPVVCPPGMEWNAFDRRCRVTRPTAQFRGLGAYLSPDIGKQFEWDSLGVGLGAMAATMTLGIATSLIIQGSHRKGRDPKIDMSLLPSLIPGIGAGIIAYLLRWNMNNLCPCEEPEITALPGRTVYSVPAQEPCPEGTVRTARGCEELI